MRVSGTEMYAETAAALVERYERVSFADLHRAFLHLIPNTPCRVLDIGSGTGRDAAALAEMGHKVIAAEPTKELRERAQALHPSPQIEWLDDSLPDLAQLIGRGETYDLALLTGVWMHLDPSQRRRAMPNVARLVRPGGTLLLTLRHGPVPPGRRLFDVSADETIELADADGLRLTLKFENQPSLLGQKDVHWTRLAFSKAAVSGAT